MRKVPLVLRGAWPLLAALILWAPRPAGACNPGYEQCGSTHCMPAGQVCCASVGFEDKFCPYGRTCDPGGQTCSGGVALACVPGSLAVIGSCGGDTCSCQKTCTGNSTCATGCCSNGYCAPSCVCQGLGVLVQNCFNPQQDGGVFDSGTLRDASYWLDDSGAVKRPAVTPDPFGTGCSAAGSGAGGPAALIALALLLARRRRHD